jgi:hypothetical protein
MINNIIAVTQVTFSSHDVLAGLVSLVGLFVCIVGFSRALSDRD